MQNYIFLSNSSYGRLKIDPVMILAQPQERQDSKKHIFQHEQAIEEEKQTAIKTVFEQETRITQSQQQEFAQEYERTIERNREHKRNWGWDF